MNTEIVQSQLLGALREHGDTQSATRHARTVARELVTVCVLGAVLTLALIGGALTAIDSTALVIAVCASVASLTVTVLAVRDTRKHYAIAHELQWHTDCHLRRAVRLAEIINATETR